MMVQKLISHLSSVRLPAILRIQTVALRAISDYMEGQNVPQIMPILLSPITDPLNHEVFDAEVSYYGQRLQLTRSITIHKPIILMGHLKGFFCFSPNIRLEKAEKSKTGRHLIEFTQIEMEFKGYDKHRFMGFVEGLVRHVISSVIAECGDELKLLGRKLKIPEAKFNVFESSELAEKHGDGYDDKASEIANQPFWILSLKREFYDKEDKEKRGYYHNYDLIWPEGFGEALSGGEREYEYEEVVRKMNERSMPLGPYETYLKILKTGNVPCTAGGGLGVERLIRYLTGLKDIDEVTIFSRKAGGKIIL